MGLNRIMVTAGVITMLQAAGQMFLTALGIAQYFCIINFLRGLPLLIYIRILYFHNPDSCGDRVNIGEAIDELPNQAFVLINELPLPVFRTFIINCTGLGLSVLWMITSVVIAMGGAKNNQSKGMRWPWIIITTIACGLDLVVTVIYANDSFQTRTLIDMMNFIGGMASGVSGVELDTSWTSWAMVLLYSRFVILFLINTFLLILVIVSLNIKPKPMSPRAESPQVTEAVPQAPVIPTLHRLSTAVQTSPPDTPIPPPMPPFSDRDQEAGTIPPETAPTRIPRAGLSKSFRRMKNFLFRRSPTIDFHRRRSDTESLEVSPEQSPRVQHVELDKKRTVNFPETLLSLPQRLENIIAEQQRRLDTSVIDTSGRNSPPRVSQSLPQLTTLPDGRERRGTTAELQGQLPWAYIPASAHRMRDQLPPDEDLPPVPLPDYSAFQSYRKASVHRAPSSISSLNPKIDYTTLQLVRSPLSRSDVLF